MSDLFEVDYWGKLCVQNGVFENGMIHICKSLTPKLDRFMEGRSLCLTEYHSETFPASDLKSYPDGL